MIKFLEILGVQGSDKRKDVIFEKIMMVENFPKQVKYVHQTTNSRTLVKLIMRNKEKIAQSHII